MRSGFSISSISNTRHPIPVRHLHPIPAQPYPGFIHSPNISQPLMSLRYILLALLISLSMGSHARPARSSHPVALAIPHTDPFLPDSIVKKIDSIFRSQHGFFALAFKDLQTGKQLMIHEQESFHAASTMKIPVMIELFRQAHEGKLKLEDPLLIHNEFQSIVDNSPYALDGGDDSFADIYKL